MRLPGGLFLIAAAALHALIPLAARVAPRTEAALIARSSRAYVEIEVEAPGEIPAAGRSAARAEAREEREAEREPEQRARAGRAARGAAQEVEPGAAQEPGPAEAPAAPGPPVDEYGGPAAAEGVVTAPGLGGARVWEIPGVLPGHAPRAAPTAPPRPRETPADKAGEVLREALQARDKAIGIDLPAAGTVASAVAEAVKSSDAPDTSRATFEVSLNGAGQVTGVRVTSMSAGAADVWARVARAAAARLAGRTLAMTAAFAKGAKIYVSVVSAVKMPSGSSSGGVQMQGAGVGFDLSDIGAHAQRVVSSSFKVVAVE